MKSYILGVWNAIDPIYYNVSRLHYVPDNDKRNTLFRVRLTRYKGTKVILKDGTAIQKNDLLLKIHLHNVRMLSDLRPISSDIKRAVLFYHMIKEALPILSRYVLSHDKNKEIKGIIGITTLYRGANRLGFETVPIKNPYYRLYKKVTFLPINHIANASYQAIPAYLFMSKETLYEKYSVH
ncbi:YkoP family protein [Virgibacillus sp. L01]|uniref:YkoP family protein n=1 Tax=Virgibacillus sp. L01 TaxID=3457429 RepID=UPI003FD4F662